MNVTHENCVTWIMDKGHKYCVSWIPCRHNYCVKWMPHVNNVDKSGINIVYPSY